MARRWVKGQTPYADFLKRLTPEEKAAHLQERANRKTMRKAMELIIEEQQSQWLSGLNNAAAVMLAKALDTGDHQAFIAVWDRIVGKPKDEVTIEDNNKPLPWNDDFDTPED